MTSVAVNTSRFAPLSLWRQQRDTWQSNWQTDIFESSIQDVSSQPAVYEAADKVCIATVEAERRILGKTRYRIKERFLDISALPPRA